MISLGQTIPSSIIWILVSIQCFGLLSAWLARLTIGCKGQTPCQVLFLASLATVGAMTAYCLSLTPFCWMGCGATLCLMVLTAIWDFGSAAETDTV